MKTLSSVWTLKATGLLFLVNLFAVPLNLRAQDDGAEFAPKTAHAVTIHAENGVGNLVIRREWDFTKFCGQNFVVQTDGTGTLLEAAKKRPTLHV
jgi:hypothetical protein